MQKFKEKLSNLLNELINLNNKNSNEQFWKEDFKRDIEILLKKYENNILEHNKSLFTIGDDGRFFYS